MKKLNLRNHYLIAFWTTLGVAISLIGVSFCLPPTGYIEPTALEGAGILLLWPSMMLLCKALEEGKTARITKGDLSVEVGDKEETDID